MRRFSVTAAVCLPLLLPSLALAQAAPSPFIRADVDFIAGMIDHHAQAVMIAKWAVSHGASSSVQDLCGRIVVAQRDEIRAFQRWLREHGLPVREPDTIWRGAGGSGMAGMSGMPGMGRQLMPGMLSAAQVAELDSARGPDFDRLFLLDMIQHHQGAITMVQSLLAVPGAGQDNLIYRIASDVNVDQTTEIERMRHMLVPLLTGGTNP